MLSKSDTNDQAAPESNNTKVEIQFTRNDPKIQHINISKQFNINKEIRRRYIPITTSGAARASSAVNWKALLFSAGASA